MLHLARLIIVIVIYKLVHIYNMQWQSIQMKGIKGNATTNKTLRLRRKSWLRKKAKKLNNLKWCFVGIYLFRIENQIKQRYMTSDNAAIGKT